METTEDQQRDQRHHQPLNHFLQSDLDLRTPSVLQPRLLLLTQMTTYKKCYQSKPSHPRPPPTVRFRNQNSILQHMRMTIMRTTISTMINRNMTLELWLTSMHQDLMEIKQNLKKHVESMHMSVEFQTCTYC